MSKSYPLVDVMCNRCGATTTVPVQYDNEVDRWLSAGPKRTVQFDRRHKGWEIKFTNDHSDFCPDCLKHFDSTD